MDEFQQGYNYHIAYTEINSMDKNRLEYGLFRSLKANIINLFFTETINMKKKTLSAFYSDLAWIYIEYFENYSDRQKVENFLENDRDKSIASLMNNYMDDIKGEDKLKEYFDRINYCMSYIKIIETKNNSDECNLIFYRTISSPTSNKVDYVTNHLLSEFFSFIDLEYTNSHTSYNLNFNDFIIEYKKLKEEAK